MKDVWHNNPTFRGGSILETSHGKVLQKMTKDICHLKTIDLGCGNQGAKEIFSDYTGVDLPEFDIYGGPLDFISEYEVVLCNAFIDVMQWPLFILAKVLKHSKNYVVLHRQEISQYDRTTVTKEDAYGSWTWHSKINIEDFKVLIEDYKIIDMESLDFDNWEGGGSSVLLRKK